MLIDRAKMALSGVTTFGPVRAYHVAVLCEKIVNTFHETHQREATDEELNWIVRSANEYYHEYHREVSNENIQQLVIQAVQTPQVTLDYLRDVYNQA